MNGSNYHSTSYDSLEQVSRLICLILYVIWYIYTFLTIKKSPISNIRKSVCIDEIFVYLEYNIRLSFSRTGPKISFRIIPTCKGSKKYSDSVTVVGLDWQLDWASPRISLRRVYSRVLIIASIITSNGKLLMKIEYCYVQEQPLSVDVVYLMRECLKREGLQRYKRMQLKNRPVDKSDRVQKKCIFS